MKKLILVLLLVAGGLIAVRLAFACNDYEDCMKNQFKAKDGSYIIDSRILAVNNADSLKAIAYKLDEISKKLDKK